MKRSKKYEKAFKKIDREKEYEILEAIKLAKEVSYSKFVGSLELAMNLLIPTKFAKESFRGIVSLPNITGDPKKVVIITDPSEMASAKKSGADVVGGEELAKDIEQGKLEFDILIASPQVMPKIASLGKVLGPKGLMPNPKNETVTTDFERVVKAYKSGRSEFRVESGGSVKAKIGKLDQDDSKLKENFDMFVETVLSETKKLGPNRLKSIVISPTMGPGIKVNISSLLKE